MSQLAARLLRVARQLLAEPQVDEKALQGTVHALYQLETEVQKFMRAMKSMDGPTAWATASDLDKSLAAFDLNKLRSTLKQHAEAQQRKQQNVSAAATPTFKEVAQAAIRHLKGDVDGASEGSGVILVADLQLVAKSEFAAQPFRPLTRSELKAMGVATGPRRDEVLEHLLSTYAYDFGRGGNPAI